LVTIRGGLAGGSSIVTVDIIVSLGEEGCSEKEVIIVINVVVGDVEDDATISLVFTNGTYMSRSDVCHCSPMYA
jgi:hypothetical protein